MSIGASAAVASAAPTWGAGAVAVKGAVPALGITSCLATAKKGLNYTNPPSSLRVTEPAGRWNLGIV